MRRIFFLGAVLFVLATLIVSCSQSITPFQAANGKAKCGRSVR